MILVKYLELMKENDVINGERNEPVKEEDINALELKIGKSFPKAYKEFLSLGGEFANMISSINHSFTYALERQVYTKNFIKKEKLEIEGGDYWVICELDGGESFHFFYFNDPDAEDPENPPVYGSYPAFLDEGYSLKEKLADSFSEYIEAKIKAYT